MKKSQRYLRGTFVCLSMLVVLFVAANRFLSPSPAQAGPERASAGQLAGLQDFSEVHISGDFDVAVEQGAAYSVSYAPVSERYGSFSVRQAGKLLAIRGYGNRMPGQAALVRIALPVLETLVVESGADARVTVSGFDTAAQLNLMSTADVRLFRNNGALAVNVRGVRNLVIDPQSAANATLNVAGGGTRIITNPSPLP